MDRKLVFMFSGQGSQYYNMGKELIEADPRFRLWVNLCCEIASDYLDTSLFDVIYQEVDHLVPFDRVLYTNPAIIAIEYSLARVLMEQGYEPDLLLGYSLGEFSAAAVSNAISIEDALKFSIEYAKLLETSTEPASMLSVLAADTLLVEQPEMFSSCWMTGKNFDNNFVVSGKQDDIKRLIPLLKQQDVVHQLLPVKHGFHTPLVDPIQRDFIGIGSRLNFDSPQTPCISCYSATEVQHFDEQHFWNLTRGQIHFDQTIQNMLGKDKYNFVDVGPNGTLATSIKYLLADKQNPSGFFPLMNQFGRSVQLLEKAKQELLPV